MNEILFYIFGALALLGGAMLVISRGPVNAALWMIVSLVAQAALLAMLDAFFLAVLQILVYAGAVMVLFIFVIMLLDIKAPSGRFNLWACANRRTVFGGGCAFVLVAYALVSVLGNPQVLASPELVAVGALPADGAHAFSTSAKSFGFLLFTKYLLPFEAAALLLLIAMLGVVHIARSHSLEEGEEANAGTSNASDTEGGPKKAA